MFKKPTTVAFKGENKLKGKEGKRLREAVANRLGGEEVAAALFPSKADLAVKKVGGGSSTQFIFADGECLLVQPDGRADVLEAELIPTLPALWKASGLGADLLPRVMCPRPVAKFIFRGADVMGPGTRSWQPARGSEDTSAPEVGSLVSVCCLDNPSACAVGRLLVPAAQLGTGVKGEAVQVLHYFGDCLWESCGSKRPQGFVGDTVQATEAPPAGAAASDDDDDAESDAEAAPAAAAASAATSGEGGEALFQPPPRPAGEGEAAKGSGEESAGEEEGAENSPEAMSEAMRDCLLQAIKTRLKDKDFPMKGNELYAQHMRPCRRAGSNIDVKASTFKKLVAFLTHCEELGWIALKKNSSEPVVTKLCRDHPDVREFKPWPKGATAEAAEAGGGAEGGGKGGTALASIEVESVWRVTKLKALFDSLAPDIVAPEDGCWSRADCAEALKRYVDKKELWTPNNKKRLAPDDLLKGILNGQDNPSMALDSLVDKFLGSLPACHRVAVPQGGAIGGVKRSVRNGKPPVVQVRTDTRRGHSVTLIHGLEAYGVDLPAFAECLKKALATATTVEEADAQTVAGIMVQGFWNVAVVDWLGKIGIPTESVQDVAKKGQTQKKAKQGSNIVKR